MAPDERSSLVHLRRGLVEFCVLALLRERERYAVELVEVLSRHDLIAGEGTIYPLLSRLRARGLVTSAWQESPSGPPRRYYGLSGDGAHALARFTSDWAALSRSVDEITHEEGGTA
ncbi:PadR family transcriptional regulator [Actinosynnema sp. NPDC050436]|uniref:PadR family transcriptional regulator n=1 Tax=Actinosynnema sp. NPDC050436 TaxID=3155659 RepID=UPI0033DC53E4